MLATIDRAAFTTASNTAASKSFEAARLPELLIKQPSLRSPDEVCEIARRLRSLAYFAQMPPNRLERLAAFVGLCPCAQYMVLYTAQQLVRMTMVVLEGEIKLGESLLDDWADNPKVEVIGPGALVAMQSRTQFGARRDEPMGHFAVCSQACIILCLHSVRSTAL
jgi:hypothetical protein